MKASESSTATSSEVAAAQARAAEAEEQKVAAEKTAQKFKEKLTELALRYKEERATSEKRKAQVKALQEQVAKEVGLSFVFSFTLS